MKFLFSLTTALILQSATSSQAGFAAYYGNLEAWGYPTEDSWYADAGAYTTIDFILPAWEPLTDQYAHLGVSFPDGDEYIFPSDAFEDGGGVNAGSPASAFMEVAFDTPHLAFMVKFPGWALFELYSGEELLFTSFEHSGPGIAPGYIGVIGDIAFDRVRIIDPLGSLHVDDIYFAMPVPAPGAIGVLALAGFLRSRRRQ